MNWIKFGKSLFITGMFVSSCASAYTNEIYTGVDLGAASSHVSCENCDNTAFVGGVLVGYGFTNYLNGELGYLNHTYNVPDQTVTKNMADVGLKISGYLTNNLSLFIRTGGYVGEASFSRLDKSNGFMGYSISGGVEYKFTSSVAANLQVRYNSKLNFDNGLDDNTSWLTFGLRYSPSSWNETVNLYSPRPMLQKQEQLTVLPEDNMQILSSKSFVYTSEASEEKELMFAFDSSTLLNTADLSPLLDFVKENPSVSKIYIEGHTDSRGDDAYNLKLSRERADAVKNYLVENGISKELISATGYGKARPVASNDTQRGRQLNRRVEVTVVTKELR